MSEEKEALRVGGGTTLHNLQILCKEKGNQNGTIFQSLGDMIHWFAGPQIRNVAVSSQTQPQKSVYEFGVNRNGLDVVFFRPLQGM